jgi:hypothetical protein
LTGPEIAELLDMPLSNGGWAAHLVANRTDEGRIEAIARAAEADDLSGSAVWRS